MITVIVTNNCGFLYQWMLQQRTLYFHRAYPHTFYFHHVVRAAHIPVVAVGVPIVLVAGAQPVSLKRFLGFFVLAPIASADGVTFDQEVANLTVRDKLIVFVDNSGFVAGKDLSARSRPDRARTVGNEHVQGFSRTDCIQNLHTKAFFEAMKERRRKRLAGGDGVADAGKIEVRTLLASVRKQRRIIRWHRKEQCRLVLLDHVISVRRRG